jgi:1,4-alpha-glucan branching enzyme
MPITPTRASSRSCGGRARAHAMLVVCNFTPVPHFSYTLGVPQAGYWREVLNSDARVTAAAASATPLATIFLKPQD